MYGDSIISANTVADGNDKLYGNDGSGSLFGFSGSGLLRGGGGNDSIQAWDRGGTSEDIVTGDGDDFISAVNSAKDTIDCGDRDDTVYFDEVGEVVADNCEHQSPSHLE
jgi:Ca2+-binding RTX toxin-like protein